MIANTKIHDAEKTNQLLRLITVEIFCSACLLDYVLHLKLFVELWTFPWSLLYWSSPLSSSMKLLCSLIRYNNVLETFVKFSCLYVEPTLHSNSEFVNLSPIQLITWATRSIQGDWSLVPYSGCHQRTYGSSQRQTFWMVPRPGQHLPRIHI